LAQTQKPDIDPLLKQEQEALTSRKQELETEIADINTRLARIGRYFTDEPPPRQPAVTPRRSATRTERGSVQMAVHNALEAAGSIGLTKAQLIEKLPTINQQSISNALKKFTTDSVVTWEGRGKPYIFKPRTDRTEAPDQASA
jgi:hypothetical protein